MGWWAVTGSNRRPSRCKRSGVASVDYSSQENGARTDTEQSETPDDFRVSFESRAPYHEHQLRPVEDYEGALQCMSVDEARTLFEMMLDRFWIHDWRGFPLPPYGLPGFTRVGYDEDQPEAKLIEIGLRYAMALIRNEGRSMHLRWREAGDFIRLIKAESEDRFYVQQAEEAMQGAERRDAAAQRQLVYFIGAASGPIKIGIALRPRERLSGLQTSHHERLELLATCEGGQEQERAYHKLFKDRRLNGEWFERTAEIEAEIERLNLAAEA
jgi:hypothetical protein